MVASRNYNLFVQHGKCDDMSYPVPSTFDLWFKCDKCSRTCTLSVNWSETDHLRLRKSQKCRCGQWVHVKEMKPAPESDKEEDKDTDLRTDLLAFINVCGDFHLEKDVNFDAFWTARVDGDSDDITFQTACNGNWCKKRRDEEEEEEEEDEDDDDEGPRPLVLGLYLIIEEV